MNDNARNFRKKYEVETTFNPNQAEHEIELEQLNEFAQLVKGTPNEELIAFKDPKVQELVDFVMAAIIIENQRINESDAFPLEIYGRYKADKSLKDKIDEWSTREEKTGMQVTDYLGFKIIPEAEHSIFYSGGDKKLQRMIDKRERFRKFVADTYQSIDDKPLFTFDEYTKKCIEILKQLIKCFPQEATLRRKFYQDKIKTIQKDLEEYTNFVEDPNTPMTLKDIYEITDVNMEQLLRELRQNYSNEVSLYKLHSDLMNTFEKSELLQSLRNIFV